MSERVVNMKIGTCFLDWPYSLLLKIISVKLNTKQYHSYQVVEEKAPICIFVHVLLIVCMHMHGSTRATEV